MTEPGADATAAAAAGARRRSDSILAKVLDSLSSDAERVELHRWVDTFRIHENDALLMVAALLYRHAGSLQKVPAQLEEAGGRFVQLTVKNVEKVADQAAEKVVLGKLRQVRSGLAEAVSHAVGEAAKAVARQQRDVSRLALGLWVATVTVLFGGLFMVCGWELGRGRLPFWMRQEVAVHGGGLAKVVGAVLGAPGGYWVLLCTLSVLALSVRARWQQRRLRVLTASERRRDLAVFAASVVGWGALALIVALLVGSPVR